MQAVSTVGPSLNKIPTSPQRDQVGETELNRHSRNKLLQWHPLKLMGMRAVKAQTPLSALTDREKHKDKGAIRIYPHGC